MDAITFQSLEQHLELPSDPDQGNLEALRELVEDDNPEFTISSRPDQVLERIGSALLVENDAVLVQQATTTLKQCCEWKPSTELVQAAQSHWVACVERLQASLEAVKTDDLDIQFGLPLPADASALLLNPILILLLYPTTETTGLADSKNVYTLNTLKKKGVVALYPERIGIMDRHNHRHSPNAASPEFPLFAITDFLRTAEPWGSDPAALVAAHNTFTEQILSWRWKNLPFSYQIIVGAPNCRFVDHFLRKERVTSRELFYTIPTPQEVQNAGWAKRSRTSYQLFNYAAGTHLQSKVVHPSAAMYANGTGGEGLLLGAVNLVSDISNSFTT